MLFEPSVCFMFFLVTEWPPISAHSVSDMFFKYKYLIVNLVFPTSVFGVASSF